MPCLTKIGTIDVPVALKTLILELSQQTTREGVFGVTALKHSRWHDGQNFLHEQLGLSVPHHMEECFQHTALFRSQPLEMHCDDQIDSKYGVMVMIDVPEGAYLRYWRSEPIPIRTGDVISIRYWQMHQLHLERQEDRLLWLTVDFNRAPADADSLWKNALNEAQHQSQGLS